MMQGKHDLNPTPPFQVLEKESGHTSSIHDHLKLSFIPLDPGGISIS